MSNTNLDIFNDVVIGEYSFNEIDLLGLRVAFESKRRGVCLHTVVSNVVCEITSKYTISSHI